MIESEKTLERKLCRKVKDLGGWPIKISSQFIKGLPDRLILMPGGFIYFVELKTTKQKPRKIQVFVHNKLMSLGFTVTIIDSSISLEAFLTDIRRWN